MGITVIMVTHDIQAATGYASHILHLGEDRQLFFGTCEDYRHSVAYHSFLDGGKTVHIWKKAAARNPAPAAVSSPAAAAASLPAEAVSEPAAAPSTPADMSGAETEVPDAAAENKTEKGEQQ